MTDKHGMNEAGDGIILAGMAGGQARPGAEGQFPQVGWGEALRQGKTQGAPDLKQAARCWGAVPTGIGSFYKVVDSTEGPQLECKIIPFRRDLQQLKS